MLRARRAAAGRRRAVDRRPRPAAHRLAAARGGAGIIYLGMAYAAFPIGLVISHAILAAVYYAVLTPIGLLMHLVGRDPMRRRFDPQAESYWIERKPDEDVQPIFPSVLT